MNKRDIAILGVQIASKELGISEIEIIFKDSAFFYNKDINAMFIQKTYTILFNDDWIRQANELEILKCAFHETRHAYQRACIDFPEIVKHDLVEVQTWKKEFDEYINPDFDGYSQQEIEKDAIKFSSILLKNISY